MENVNDTKKQHIADLFFRIGIICEMVAGFSGYIDCGEKMQYVIFFGMFCLLVKTAICTNLKKDWLIYLIMFAFGGLCYYFQHSALVIRIVLLLLAGRDKDSKKVIRMMFVGTLVITVAVMLLAVLGIKGELSMTARFRGDSVETRYCYGFLHPNSFAIVASKLILMYFYGFFDKLKSWGFVTVSILIFPFIWLSGSITGIVVSAFVIVMTGFIKIVKKDFVGRLIFAATFLGSTVLVGFSAFVMFCYDGKLKEENGNYIAEGILEPINQMIFHGRLSIARHAYQECGIRPMGMDRNTVTTENGFINAAINHGYIFIILYLLLVFYLLCRFYKMKNNIGMVLIAAVMLYSFMEAFIPYGNKNLIILAGMGIILGKRNEQHLPKK